MFCLKLPVYQKNIFIFLFLTSFCASKDADAQSSNKIDSLKNELRISAERNQFNVLWGLAYELFDIDNEEAIKYAKLSRASALRDGDSVEIVKSGRILGQLLRRMNELDESIKVLADRKSVV